MDNQQTITIASARLSAQIDARGAELVRLQDGAQRDVLWNGDPAFWSGRAPLLFPMVGRAKGDRIRVDGRSYALPQHGFARRSLFALARSAPDSCTFSLASTDVTLAAFPFRFQLAVTYRIAHASLSIEARVLNSNDRPMPVSFGFHPAFRWPLPGAASRENHAIVFERDEPAPIRRLVDGLLAADPVASPVVANRLALSDDLFRADALVLDHPASRRVRYAAPNSPAIDIAFPDMPQLGIWSKPGAGFVCIEPWQGFASPDDFDGDFADRPGVVQIAPGAARSFGMTIEITD